MRTCITLFLVMAVSLPPVFSQEVDNQLWLNYALSVQKTENLSFGGDIGARGLISNEDWNQFLVRPSISYRFNQIVAVQGAMSWFGTLNEDIDDINEFRLHQEVNVRWPDFTFMALFYRIRLEQRTFIYPEEDNDFNFRSRFLIGAESADFLGDKRIFGGRRPFYLQVLFEVFNTNEDALADEFFVNNTRTHFALGERISDNFRYELHYIRQRSRQFTSDGLQTSQNIFRVRFFHRINKIKQESVSE